MMTEIAPSKERPEASPTAILVAKIKFEKYGSSHDPVVVKLSYTCSGSIVTAIISMLTTQLLLDAENCLYAISEAYTLSCTCRDLITSIIIGMHTALKIRPIRLLYQNIYNTQSKQQMHDHQPKPIIATDVYKINEHCMIVL